MYAIFEEGKLLGTTADPEPFKLIEKFTGKCYDSFSEREYLYITVRMSGIKYIDIYTKICDGLAKSRSFKLVDPCPDMNNIKRSDVFESMLIKTTGYSTTTLLREIKINGVT